MSRPLTIRQPRRSEVRRLDDFLAEDGLTSSQRRRAEAIALYAAGLTAVDIAAALQAHANTIYADLHAFDQAGLAAIHQIGRRGATCRITPAQRQRILRIAEQPPYALGLPYGGWSLANLRAYLIQQRILKSVSREHLRQILKKGGSSFAVFNAN